jgi:hypothetical protein
MKIKIKGLLLDLLFYRSQTKNKKVKLEYSNFFIILYFFLIYFNTEF